MIAAFAQVNGVDLRQENHGALQRLAERVMKGVDDEETFEEKTGEDQDMTDLKVDNKYAWLEPYRPLPLRAEDARGEEGPRAVQQFPPRRRSDAGVQPRRGS